MILFLNYLKIMIQMALNLLLEKLGGLLVALRIQLIYHGVVATFSQLQIKLKITSYKAHNQQLLNLIHHQPHILLLYPLIDLRLLVLNVEWFLMTLILLILKMNLKI